MMMSNNRNHIWHAFELKHVQKISGTRTNNTIAPLVIVEREK